MNILIITEVNGDPVTGKITECESSDEGQKEYRPKLVKTTRIKS